MLAALALLLCTAAAATSNSDWRWERYFEAQELRSSDDASSVAILKELDGQDDDVAGAAAYDLGEMYERGVPGVLKRDRARAVALYNRSSHLGNMAADHQMAFVLSTGALGTVPSEEEAVSHEEAAALSGYPPAMMSMGFRFLHGLGVRKDCETALFYYKDAAETLVQVDDTLGSAPVTDVDRLNHEMLSQRRAAAQQGNLDEVGEYWRYHSDMGDMRAQHEVGKMYDAGSFGVGVDASKAAEAFQKAAAQGYAPAMTDLALMQAQGAAPGEHTQSESISLLEAAAEAGDATAQIALGIMHLMGPGALSGAVEQPSDGGHNWPGRDEDRARRMFTLAADQQNPEALFYLGELSSSDAEKLMEEIASTEGEAAEALVDAADSADSEALRHYAQSAKMGFAMAALREAQMRIIGRGGDGRSCAVAARKYKSVAESAGGMWGGGVNMEEAVTALMDGNDELALSAYSRAALEGHVVAQVNAGWMCRHARGCGSSSNGGQSCAEEAMRWYRYAAMQGDSEADEAVGILLSTKARGGTKPDFEAAAEHLRRAARAGHAGAMARLAWMHRIGKGVDRNLSESLRLLREAIGASNSWGARMHMAAQMVYVGIIQWVRGLGGALPAIDGPRQRQAFGGAPLPSTTSPSNLFWIRDATDGSCLSGSGFFSPACDELNLWSASPSFWGKRGQGSVFLFQSSTGTGTGTGTGRSSAAQCLDAKKRKLGHAVGAVGTTQCGAGRTEKWSISDEGALQNDNGQYCLSRAKGTEDDAEATMRLCIAGHTRVEFVDVNSRGAGDGFALISAVDGACFNGTHFDSGRTCRSHWAIELRGEEAGKPIEAQYSFRAIEDEECLDRARCHSAESSVRRSSCQHCGAIHWALRNDGRLCEDGCRNCIARKDDGSAEIRHCSRGFEAIRIAFD